MLYTHEKWKFQSLDKKETFFVEANWKPEDQETNEGKVLKFTFPDGKKSYIKRDDLNQVLFAIGDPEAQRKMIPQKITHRRWYETVLGITAQKDIKKGEQINCRVKLTLPKFEDEIVGELKEISKKGIRHFADGTPILGTNK